MNFIFISPHFPKTYWEFCARLKQNGVKVLGLADAPYDSLSEPLRNALTEYYRVNSLENYDDVFRAVAFLSFKYGKIDWVESNNEYWLSQDARLRTDFHITTGIGTDAIRAIKSKSEMKKYYARGNIPTARQDKVSTPEALSAFAREVGYPLIAKPDTGVGSGGTYKITGPDDIAPFFATKPPFPYVTEEFITGEICSYDAVINEWREPVFEAMTVWPPSIMDIVNKQLDLSYYVDPDLPEALKELGRRTVKVFNVSNRFVHLEFFRLSAARPGLGGVGDFVALEVNMRPAGGYTPDMINYAHSTDVYQIWADMVAFQKTDLRPGRRYFCAFASRRDAHSYRHSHDAVVEKYRDRLVMCDRMPEILSAAMGNQMYTARLETRAQMEDFIAFVHEKSA